MQKYIYILLKTEDYIINPWRICRICSIAIRLSFLSIRTIKLSKCVLCTRSKSTLTKAERSRRIDPKDRIH